MFVFTEQEWDAEIVDVAPSCPADLLRDWEGVC